MIDSVFVGIDYGSKKAGTTVITQYIGDQLVYACSSKNEDADIFIIDYVTNHNIKTVYIDAPLSLPNALVGKGSNYFYRASDRSLGAMSPMFLGGLTARAIALKDKLIEEDVQCYEVYPGGFIREVFGAKYYDKKDLSRIKAFCDRLYIDPELPPLREAPPTWHHVDSLLAWYIGYRHQKGKAQIVGNLEEGQIII